MRLYRLVIYCHRALLLNFKADADFTVLLSGSSAGREFEMDGAVLLLLPTGVVWRSEVMFSATSVCLFVCVFVSLFVCLHDNFRTTKHRTIKLGGEVHRTKISPKFEGQGQR